MVRAGAADRIGGCAAHAVVAALPRRESPLLATTNRVPGAVITERAHSVPLDHSQPDGEKITVFTRRGVSDPEQVHKDRSAQVPAVCWRRGWNIQKRVTRSGVGWQMVPDLHLTLTR